jgi:hypothetical protein
MLRHVVMRTRRLVAALVTLAATTSCQHSGLTQHVAILDGAFGVAGSVPNDAARDLKVQVPVGGGCEQTGTARVMAVESATLVSLTATVTRATAAKRFSGNACPANLVVQTVAVHLREPLGSRVVRDAVADKNLARKRFPITPR